MSILRGSFMVMIAFTNKGLVISHDDSSVVPVLRQPGTPNVRFSVAPDAAYERTVREAMEHFELRLELTPWFLAGEETIRLLDEMA